MIRVRFGVALALGAVLLTAAAAGAEVKTSEKAQLKFEGALGKMMGLFGGKAAKEGIVTNVAVKGDRMIRSSDDTATIVDLAEEKVYELNLKDKSYKVYTFAEMRQRLEEARAKAESDARKQEAREQKKDPNQKEMELDFSVKETGQKRQINGYACREVVMIMAIHEKGKTLDQSGGMLMTVNSWLAPRIAAVKEIEEFDRKYAQRLGEGLGPNAAQMAQAFAMYPDLKKGMSKLQAEKVNMDGTAIETVMTVQTVQTAEQASARKKDDNERTESPAGALGGMLGRLGRKKEEPKAEPAPKAVADSDTRTTFMTTTSTLLSVGTTVSAEEVGIPAGFKNKR